MLPEMAIGALSWITLARSSGLAGPEQRRAVASRRSSTLFWLIAER
jgi:hypothetical protein